jgi:uncharacterized protein
MLDHLAHIFKHQTDILLALVFGSAARASLRPDSDIDIAVLSKQPLNSLDKQKLIGEIALATGRSVDLIDLATVGQPLLGQIIKDAKRIKGSDSQFAKLLVRNALDEADFMPYVSRLLQTRRAAWIG